MFSFGKEKPLIVHFFTTREEVFLHAKPKKAMQYMPKWVKELPKPHFPEDMESPLHKKLNMKSCPGLVNLYRKGFVFPLWSDLNVEIIGDGWRYQFSDELSKATQHETHQFQGSSFEKEYTHLKLNNPWAMMSNIDVDLLFTAPSWNGFGFDDTVVVPGAYSARHILGQADVNLFFKKHPERKIYEFKFGHPLAHVIPLTERKLVLKYELVTETELNKMHRSSGLWLFGSNRYRQVKCLNTA